jgi:hypothetical protein
MVMSVMSDIELLVNFAVVLAILAVVAYLVACVGRRSPGRLAAALIALATLISSLPALLWAMHG